MVDDTHDDDMINLVDPSKYDDPVSQRAMAFCDVAKLANTVQDGQGAVFDDAAEAQRSIRTPLTADLRSIEGAHKKVSRAPSG